VREYAHLLPLGIFGLLFAVFGRSIWHGRRKKKGSREVLREQASRLGFGFRADNS